MQKITITIQIPIPEEGLEINKEKEAKRKRIISNIVTIVLATVMVLGMVWFFHECAEKQFEAHIEYLEEEGYIK